MINILIKQITRKVSNSITKLINLTNKKNNYYIEGFVFREMLNKP